MYTNDQLPADFLPIVQGCSRKPCGPVPLAALIEPQFQEGKVEGALPFDYQQGEELLDGKTVSVGNYPHHR